MLFIEPALYLPITRETIQNLLSTSSLDEVPLHQDEIAAAITIQCLPRLFSERQPISNAEKILANAISLASEQMKDNTFSNLPEEFARYFKRDVFIEGVSLLDTLHIAFLSQEEIDRRPYIDYDQKWDYTFTRRHSSKQ